MCQTSLAHFKASNLQRHFSSLHANIDQEFPKGTELRKHELATLKSQAEKQIQFFQKFTKRSETITLASYQLAWNIARAKKPYNEGEFVKKCLSDIVEILSPENDKLKRMVSDVQLSRHAVEHTISDINTAIESQLHSDLEAYNVMKPVMEIVNYIRTHALNHRQFKNLIAELDQGLPGDLPLHCTVRWLSKGQVLSRFFELLDAVKLFMEEKDKNYPELSDLKWIMDLAFLVDMLCHLDRLNLTLQGKLKMLPDLVQSVFAFVNKLKLFKTHIQKGHLTHFPTLLKASGQVASPALSKQRARYATLIENLHESFVTRFHDLQLKRPQITFLVDPFNAETGCLKVPLVTDEAAAELEMIDLCEEDQLKPALREGTTEFWKSVPMEKYPNVKWAALKILSMFGSTYVCESVFSTLKHVKSKHRSAVLC
ncbi:unnamed protein product, partial [Oreochromis niloticus]